MGIRKKLFSDMTSFEIVGEVIGSIIFVGLLLLFVYGSFFLEAVI